MTDAATREPVPLPRLFAEAARRHARRTAVEVPPGTGRPDRVVVSYADLAARAARLAALLAPVARPDAIVAILLPRHDPDVYAAQLGAWGAGAAYTCLDPRFPDGHLRAVLEDARPVAVVADDAGASRLAGLGLPLPTPLAVPRVGPDLPYDPPAPAPCDLAYVIYTSGTTGRPKGVMIEHRGVANLVASDLAEFGLVPEDRCAQVSSPAYDSSVEETWLAFSVGAALLPFDDETARLGPDLVPWLRRERVTVFCPPPTMLRATACEDPATALPLVRLVYVGGEAFPADLADRWAPGRRVENGYGPTECTVTVVRTQVHAGRPVTIGKPIQGHAAWVLDERGDEVPDGEPGELCIGGVGLARGYLRRPELTEEKFPAHPRLGRIYRSGDLARRNAEGDLEYLGRIDGQVKLRGYRVELGAVEAHLAALPGVRAAGCRVQGEGGAQVLAAHVVPSDGCAPDPEGWRAALRRALPEYMVPARFAVVPALPVGVSGKLDRRALPEIEGPSAAPGAADAPPPADPVEAAVAAAFARALRAPGPVRADADFFLDLGGDSLAAVTAVVALRERVDLAHATVRDIYEARTATALAARLRAGAATSRARPADPAPAGETTGRAHPVLSTAAQAAWLLAKVLAGSAAAYAIWFGLAPWLLAWATLPGALVAAPFLLALARAALAPVAVLAAVAVKRALVGRYRPMRTPVWSGFWTRHWIAADASRWIPWRLIEGTEFEAVALRALGARVGRGVHIHRGVDVRGGGWDLLALGDDATLSQDAAVRVVELEAGHAVFGPVTVEAEATLDVRAGASPHTTVGRGAWLGPLAWLRPGARVPPGERWDGVPAERTGLSPEPPPVDRSRDLSATAHGLLLVAARCAHSGLAALAPAAVAAVLAATHGLSTGDALAWLANPTLSGPLGVALLLVTVLSLPLGLLLEGLACRLLGRVRPGAFSRLSPEAVRVRLKTGAVDAANRWLSGAMLWPWWLRLAGMRVGRGCEISTIIDTVPETVSIGDESFFADGIYFCGPRVHRGTVTVAATAVGRDTFLGNHAVVPAGHRWPDGLFVGVSTVADAARARAGTGWFGVPPMELPRREVVAEDRRLTHDPDLLRRATRAFWESMRLALPVLPLLVLVAWLDAASRAAASLPTGLLLAVGLPTATLAAAAVPCAAVVALKWLLLGRVRPGRHAFWSCWCMRWDLLYVAWDVWARDLLAALDGTLLQNAYLRLHGMRIGRRVALGTGFAQVVDPDMLDLEDGATVACQFQAHTFEDRILKIDRLRVGAGATVGPDTVLFYGANVGEGSRVAPNSVVMKREVLPPGAAYAGCPARRDGPVGGDAWAAEALPLPGSPGGA